MCIMNYPRQKNFFYRILYWRGYIFYYSKFFLPGILILSVFVLCSERLRLGLTGNDLLYMMLIGYPSMMSWESSQLKRVLENELLKPIKRVNLIREIGAAILLVTLEAYLKLFIFIEIIRLLVISPHMLFMKDVWIRWTLAFCSQIFFWGLLAYFTYFGLHVFFIIFIGASLIALFINVGFPILIIISLVCLLSGIFFAMAADRLWYKVEFRS